jgi:Rod binding domain-containing protein
MGIAMQSLGASMTASGGIGIAKMISTSLHKAEDARVSKTQTSVAK